MRTCVRVCGLCGVRCWRRNSADCVRPSVRPSEEHVRLHAYACRAPCISGALQQRRTARRARTPYAAAWARARPGGDGGPVWCGGRCSCPTIAWTLSAVCFLQAIGLRNQIDMQKDHKRRTQRHLQIEVDETNAEFERLSCQYESLVKIETEQVTRAPPMTHGAGGQASGCEMGSAKVLAANRSGGVAEAGVRTAF